MVEIFMCRSDLGGSPSVAERAFCPQSVRSPHFAAASYDGTGFRNRNVWLLVWSAVLPAADIFGFSAYGLHGGHHAQ